MITRPFNFEAHLTRPSVRLPIVPFIDLGLIGLFFILLSSRFVVAPGVVLNLPTMKSSEVDFLSTPYMLAVSQVENRERLLFEGGNHTLLTLEKALSGRRGEFSSQTLLVEADRDVSMDMLTRLNEIVRAAGFARVMYAVKPEEALAPGAVNAQRATAR